MREGRKVAVIWKAAKGMVAAGVGVMGQNEPRCDELEDF